MLFFAKLLIHRVKNEKVMTKTSSQLNVPVLMTEPAQGHATPNLGDSCCTWVYCDIQGCPFQQGFFVARWLFSAPF